MYDSQVYLKMALHFLSADLSCMFEAFIIASCPLVMSESIFNLTQMDNMAHLVCLVYKKNDTQYCSKPFLHETAFLHGVIQIHIFYHDTFC